MNIEQIKQIQGKLSDQQFADKLGIHRASWGRIKRSPKPLSDKFMVRLHKAYPELNLFAREMAQDTRQGRLKTFLAGMLLRARKIWYNSHEL